MKTLQSSISPGAIFSSVLLSQLEQSQSADDFFVHQKRNKNIKHVHLMHIDGVRPDIFREMLAAGQLPHFKFLLQRGKISYTASTVDKSETMKVIQSYLTSKIDTKVVGWWQFDRTSFQFRNFWLNPIEIINYALGLEFPVYPTVYDYFAARKKNQLAGFTLHRRGIPFENYGRAYAEGGMAVKKHTYFDQAHATMQSLRQLIEREVRNIEAAGGGIEELPVLTTSLIAPADEFGHLHGVYKPKSFFDFLRFSTNCFINREPYKIFFDFIENNSGATVFTSGLSRDRDFLGQPRIAHFNFYYPAEDRLCIQLPKLTQYRKRERDHHITARKRYAQRDYALALIAVDIELGNLINTLRSVDLSTGKPRYVDNPNKGIGAYVRNGKSENTLFEQTLFIIFSDHGMTHSPNKITTASETSNYLDFIRMLNKSMGLQTAENGKTLKQLYHGDAQSVLFGVDDKSLPPELYLPHRFIDQPFWSLNVQDKTALQKKIAKAEEFTQNFIKVILSINGHLVAKLKKEVLKKFWWLLIFRDDIVEPRFDAAIEEGKMQAMELITQLYLKGDPQYVKYEQIALRNFYDQHIRLVYGGGARNNAELFLPRQKKQEGEVRYRWERRPTYEEILKYRPGSGDTLIQTLKANPGVDLIFIRHNNGEIMKSNPTRGAMKITVLNTRGHKGTITVKRDEKSAELLFSYEVDAGSRDPIGYNSDLPANRTDPRTFATYTEWNDLSIAKKHYYHNVVAGMGSYLYSNNPAIGDITITPRQNWNFGGNSGGHGGVHREEKLIVFMVSGPGIRAGDGLMAHQRYQTDDSGHVQPSKAKTHPTLLDAIPTIYQWLGVSENDLKEFVQNDFQTYLKQWAGEQQEQILGHLDLLEDEVDRIGIGRPEFQTIKDPIKQLLRFMLSQPTDIYNEIKENDRMDGHPVIYEE
jgi:hypothetical protein